MEIGCGGRAPVMMSKSAIVTQPPARNVREGSSWIADRCLSRYCGREYESRRDKVALVRMPCLNVMRDCLSACRHDFSGCASQKREQKLVRGCARCGVVPVKPSVDFGALLRVLGVHLHDSRRQCENARCAG